MINSSGFPSSPNVLCFYLIYVADHNWGEEDLRERESHGVDCSDHGGVHEVDGVAVEEDGRASHGNTHDHRPEDVLETWTEQRLNKVVIINNALQTHNTIQ